MPETHAERELRRIVTDHKTAAAVLDGCRCATCHGIHAEFIGQFGRWPRGMTHQQGLELRDRRESNLASWDRSIR